jgi:hypothetical protein
MLKLKPALFAALAFAPIFILVLALSRHDYSWADWKPATCMPDWCFCEAQRSGIITQPANTWSSLGFVFVGLLILSQRYPHTKPASAFSSTHALVYSLATIFIGLGSTFYHASLTFLGQFFDVMGMYLLAGFILLYNLSRTKFISSFAFVLLYAALNLVLAALLIILPELRRYLFAALILVAPALAYLPRGVTRDQTKRRYLRAAILTLLVAFVIFLLDLTKIFCRPESWLQGHALWHLGGALAAGLLYLHYRNEQSPGHS